ncbi:hypothetical protein HPB50_004764 [Hyalomma asiaticum]|uniref:Uncharacterized protein n=1 Tax=Hyalomma asiaticum TaxID=266040 RepID=A0ACB7SAD1_HYAAI|nr:hypothetical protein HPB50_004764 [Hyalomma asiaticum]
MQYAVEWTEIPEAEVNGASRQPPSGRRAQGKGRQEIRRGTPNPRDAEQATLPQNAPKPLPPTQRGRGPLPRMPANTIQIAGRPKTPIALTKAPPWVYTKLCSRRCHYPTSHGQQDQVRVHQ